jgi:hypothetical protein
MNCQIVFSWLKYGTDIEQVGCPKVTRLFLAGKLSMIPLRLPENQNFFASALL